MLDLVDFPRVKDRKCQKRAREELKKIRAELGFTQKELADSMGVQQRDIYNWERGRSNILFSPSFYRAWQAGTIRAWMIAARIFEAAFGG